jgi:O-antigen chain-terminating methyltransferase
MSKVDEQEVARLEQRLRDTGDALDAHMRRQLEMVEKQILSQVDAKATQIESFARMSQMDLAAVRVHVDSIVTKSNIELMALRSAVGVLEQWTAEQPPREQLEAAAAAAVATERIGRELTTLRTDTGRIDVDLATVRADAVRVDVKLTAVDQRLLEYRQNLLEQERRLGVFLENASKRVVGTRDRQQSAAAKEEADHLYDGFYASFEGAFRGTREDIKQRVEIYLPYVREVGAGTTATPIVDIGCGRGEWLEVLRENGLDGTGVDLNRINAAQCRERGLVVAEGDALAYLRGLKTGSIGAVTAIHVIEHLAFRNVISLFDEVRRVLKPGAIAIFETPNPENLVVGACNFWYDPTHQQPLPPEPMRFILDNRGFTRVEILRLHPNTQAPLSTGAGNELSSVIAERLYGPQDYALIGYKA